MQKHLLSLLFIIICHFGHGQLLAQPSAKTNDGIVYFSSDNGHTWQNASNGLPQKVRIGLGGIAVSEKSLGVATKEYGVFVYDFKKNSWTNLPTDKQIIDANIGAMAFYKNTIYIGTQDKGVYSSDDNGTTWKTQNTTLNNLSIRRFLVFDDNLYLCTNDGFYVLNQKSNSWTLEYGQAMLQVNGATQFKNQLYIATNKGIYAKKSNKNWENILPNHSVHNVSSDDYQLYAMTYNELLLSSKDGAMWQKNQDGLPKLYTFNVLTNKNVAFAGQWYGIYSKTAFDPQWRLSSSGLPSNFAVTNLKTFNEILVISTSERKLKTDITTKK